MAKFRQNYGGYTATAMGASAGYLASRLKRKYKASPKTARKPASPIKYRKKTGTASRTVTKSKVRKTSQQTNQWSRDQMSTGRSLTPAMRRMKLTNACQEPVMFSFRGVKKFDDHGNYPCYNQLFNNVGTLDSTALPVYVFALNHINQVNSTALPCRRLVIQNQGVDDGKLRWTVQGGISPLGTASSTLQYLTKPDATQSGMSRALWDYSTVKFNLWGARNKPVRFTVQVVRALEATCSPFHYGSDVTMGIRGQQAWSEMIKQYTFNPIDKLDWTVRKYFKVLKTYNVIIDPTATTDGDVDPQCRTLEWHMKFGRVEDYRDATINDLGAVTLTDDAQVFTNASRVSSAAAYSTKPATDERSVFVLVRASNYTDSKSVFTNDTDGSFDFDMRTRFTTLSSSN